MRFEKSSLSDIQGVLFDLDGTLLQVDMEKFIPAYIHALSCRFRDLVDADQFREAILASATRLLRNQGQGETNEAIFLDQVQKSMGIEPDLFQGRLQQFFQDGLAGLSPMIRALPLARRIVQSCFDQGLKVAIATNPVFPRSVVDARLEWGNLSDFQYHFVASYENSHYCKPDERYFLEILAKMELAPEQCLMVGNDTDHDLAARRLGISTFLVETWLIHRKAEDWVSDFSGDHRALFNLISQVASVGRNN